MFKKFLLVIIVLMLPISSFALTIDEAVMIALESNNKIKSK